MISRNTTLLLSHLSYHLEKCLHQRRAFVLSPHHIKFDWHVFEQRAIRHLGMGNSLGSPGRDKGNSSPVGNQIDYTMRLLHALYNTWFKSCLPEESHLCIVNERGIRSRP